MNATVQIECPKCYRFHDPSAAACPPPPVTATLPVTGVVVPAAAAALTIKITGEMNTYDGVAFTAEVRDGKHLRGVIEQDGRGGGTDFRHATYADAQWFAALVDEYAAIDEEHRWVAHESLCNDLYEEVAMIRDLNRKRTVVIRIDKDNDQILGIGKTKPGDAGAAAWAARRYGDRAEVWSKAASRWIPATTI